MDRENQQYLIQVFIVFIYIKELLTMNTVLTTLVQSNLYMK